jgi:hypothetical protein
MKPMKPMAPMPVAEPWWPAYLGSPSTSGAQNGLRYAFFRDQRRLLIEREGQLNTYDTADHNIGGVSQADSGIRSVEFTSQHGLVGLDELEAVD